MRPFPTPWALAAALLLTACGVADQPAAPRPPSGAGRLVVGLREIPGKPSVSIGSALPRVSLYGDRRLIMADGRSGALQLATVHPLTPGRFKKVYEDAYAARRAASRNAATPDAVDAGTLVLRLGTEHGLDRVQTPARSEGPLTALDESLAPSNWPASAFSSAPTPYVPARIAVIASGTEPGTAADRPWPLAPLGGSCTVLGGALRLRAEALARGATTETRWSSRGRVVRLTFRPLLPDESGCGALNRL